MNLNNSCQELKRGIQCTKNESICSHLRELIYDSNTDYSLSKTTSRLETPTIHSPLIRLEDGNWAGSNKQKADKFGTYSENILKIDQSDQSCFEIEISPKFMKNNCSNNDT